MNLPKLFCLPVVCAIWAVSVWATPAGATPSNKNASSSYKNDTYKDARTITVGSKPFTESRLLAEIMAQVIERDLGVKVRRRINLGGSKIVFAALQAGEIDLYPEYTGTAWAVHMKQVQPVRDSLRMFLSVAEAFRRDFGCAWLSPFGFSNGYGLAMTPSGAARFKATRLSDLTDKPRLRFGFSHEFLKRPDGFPGLKTIYSLDGDVTGIEHGLVYQALLSDQVDVIDTWTTDGKLARYGLVVLEDDKSFFPPYDAAPVVRQDTLDAFPGLRETLSKLAFQFDNQRMQMLNRAVEDAGGDFAGVARRVVHDLLGQASVVSGVSDVPAVNDTGGPSAFAHIWRMTGQHLVLSLGALGVALILAVPLGIGAAGRPRLGGLVLTVCGVLQTIPGLALLALLIPLPGFGLGGHTALTVLVIYALLPIVRNTVVGIQTVDPVLVEAGQGLGLTPGQILREVTLPLALPTMMAGVRTAAVVGIGVATLAAFIGGGGYGEAIVTGLQLNDSGVILRGAIPAAVLAVAVDAGLGWIQKKLATPR